MRQLGPYQLLRKIGHGGMAEVWSAKRSAGIGGADKYVAIKLLAPHLAGQNSYRDMFLAEARLSMMLNHSNIVQVFDAIEDPPDCYMVMELVEGMTLAQLERALGKQGSKIPLEVSAYVIGELLRALAHAHGVSLDAGSVIVHRDVSPQNVMVTTAGEVKLMDFGIARFATEETQGIFVKGKLQYMPPEQLRMETRKPTIDLFAVGAILHELIDGRRFRGKIDQARLFGMVLQGEVPVLQTTEEVPIELDELRLGLLEADEDRRIQSAKEALQLLQRWPGYRHAALELEELVQLFVAPSSSLATPDPTASESSSSESAMRQLDPRAAAETCEDGGVEGTDTALDPVATSGRRRWLWAGASLLLSAGIGAAAFVLVNPLEDPAVAVEATQAPEVDAQPPAPIESVEDPELIAEEPIVPDEDPRVLVWVEFVAKEAPSLWLRVNGRILEIEPRMRLRLPVGSFNVYVRADRHGDWIKAGRITLEDAHEYRVELLDPPDLRMTGRPN
jgi:serine/threonine protein kinase